MDNQLEGQADTRQDLKGGERGDKGKVTMWRNQIEYSLKYEKPWREESSTYMREYQDEKRARLHSWELSSEKNNEQNYNIFWANTQTLRPLVFSRLPEPNITPRYTDNDELSRIASEMMERATSYCLDEGNAFESFAKSRDDFLIAGRGVVRVYMDSELVEIEEEKTDEKGNKIIEIVEEVDEESKKLRLEYVKYDNIVLSTETEPSKIKWIAFKHLMSKEEIKNKFTSEKANRVSYSSTINDSKDDINNDEDGVSIFNRAEIWEIWDKVTKKVYWITATGDEILLDEIDDPYQLKNFFPVPSLLGISENPVSCLPIPLYRLYRTQALELNDIDERVRNLNEQLKFQFVYASNAESEDLENLFNGEDGKGSPMKGMNGIADLSKSILFKPIVELVNVIDKLEQRKQIVINNIREITGLSDIVRGVSAPTETASAQQLKSNFAISRIQPLQKAQEAFIRDTQRLLVELLVENYSIVELAKMTNLKIIDIEAIAQATQEKQQKLMKEAAEQLDLNDPQRVEKMQLIQDQAKEGFRKTMEVPMNELKGYAVTPEQLKDLDRIIKDDKLRSFKVDVETDSTVEVDQQQERQDRVEFASTISNMANSLFPLVQAGIINKSAFNKFLQFVASPFKVGRNLQEFLEDDEQEDESNPQEIQQKAEADLLAREIALKEQELGLKSQESQQKYEIEKEKNSIEKAKVLKDIQQFEDKLEFEDVNKQADRDAKSAEEIIKARTEILNSTIRNTNLDNS